MCERTSRILTLRQLLLAAAALILGAASPPATEAPNGMVVSSQRLAAEAGIEILKIGGNAVDAAVAVAYTEAVTNPCCGNLGGGGFLTLRLVGGQTAFLNFRETAPAAATPDMYLGRDGSVVPREALDGWKAVAVPGSVAGLDAALVRYGTLPRSVVMAPAIRIAREGFTLTRGDTDIMARAASRLRRQREVARIFLRPDGSSFEPGDRLVQRDLAATLELVAETGPDAFYHGRIPKAVAAAAAAGGGLITEADFAGYRATEEGPLRCWYRGFEILSAPPPSSGGTTLCMILGVLEGYDVRSAGWNSARSVHLIAEAARYAYLDRNTHLGDPAFVRNPIKYLLSTDYLTDLRTRLGDTATPSSVLRPSAAPAERPETTHLSVMDRAGNAVGVTFTINGSFGAGVMAPGTGFLLNNEMDDFTVKPGVSNQFGLVQGDANVIAPNKRPLSSMTPTIVVKDGQTVMVLGSPGGSRIITIVLQVLLNMIDHGMSPQEAVDAPRVHHQWLPDAVFFETQGLSADTRAVLERQGHRLTEQTPWGAVALITRSLGRDQRVPSSGTDSVATTGTRPALLYGANDSRRPAGAALGY